VAIFFGNLATGHFSGKKFFDGHSSGHTGSNDTGLKFVSCWGREIGRSGTDTQILGIYNIDNSKIALEFICYNIRFKYNAFSPYISSRKQSINILFLSEK